MIRRVEIRGYRALRQVDVPVGDFQILIGPNASGKSTFFDAIMFVRDILEAGLPRAVWGDDRFGIPPRAADPNDITWQRAGESVTVALEAALPPEIQEIFGGRYSSCRYELSVSTAPEVAIENEFFWLCAPSEDGPVGAGPLPLPAPHSRVWGETRHVSFVELDNDPSRWVIGRSRTCSNSAVAFETSHTTAQMPTGAEVSALATSAPNEAGFPATTWFRHFLIEGLQCLVLDVGKLRRPSAAGLHRSFLPDGSNVPWVAHRLKEEAPELFADWLEHVQTALPDLTGIDTVEREEDRSRYLVLEYGDLRVPSWAVSDGTLRLLALTLLAYAQEAPRLVLIEEPENGLHPQALHAVFQSLTSCYDRQVFFATHSPIFLGMASPEQLLCFGKTDDGAVKIVPGHEHPQLRDWQGALDLGSLFAAGILS